MEMITMTNNTNSRKGAYVKRDAVSRITGVHTQVLDLAHEDSEYTPDVALNRFAAVCVTHGELTVAPTERIARWHAVNTGGFCDDCYDLLVGGEKASA
jgi:hypothetical protein